MYKVRNNEYKWENEENQLRRWRNTDENCPKDERKIWFARKLGESKKKRIEIVRKDTSAYRVGANMIIDKKG